MTRFLGGVALAASAVFTITIMVAAVSPGSMLGPYLLLWVVTILPIAFVPQWTHPKLRTRDERRVYKILAAVYLTFTWLAMTAVDHLAGALAGWVWTFTFGSFLWLNIHSIRERITYNKTRKLTNDDPLFDDIDRAFIAELRREN